MSNEVSLEGKIFPVTAEWKSRAYVNSMEQYKEMWQRSIDDPEGFWGDIAEEYVTWAKKWDKVCEYDWDKSPEHKWFINGKLNVPIIVLTGILKKVVTKLPLSLKAMILQITGSIRINSFMKRYVNLQMS